MQEEIQEDSLKSIESKAVTEGASRLEERAYKTYLARVRAHQRLGRRNNAWNTSMIALSTSTTIASVGLLVNRPMYGTGGDTLMAALAILSLVSSLVVSSVNYGGRARAMEASYKRIQQISLAAEDVANDPSQATRQRLNELQREYAIAIDASENHSDADYHRSQKVNWRKLWRDSLVSYFPYATLAVPIGLMVPFAKWFIDGL
ncbi:SLATT domain-containing protein [Amycolatopsis balhimycina]|uniref:SLATT domain-containing protein n=1 Tax=Amycolatopsis balhimycina TaxID=208443 RepID=UPI00146F25DE|nr:SLATT domain-containing protein [Amycolatopsis balhimycina]